jgi:23S rRNA (pseudouridine1915-N3)-methyltransferase
MKVLILAVGRLKEPYLREAEAEYHKRLRPYCQLELREVKDEATLAAALPKRANLYVLDERGECLTSEGFAREVLGREASFGRGAHVVFAIGGPDGHSDAIRARARRLLAFGKMTIAHRLMRTLLLEQLYRGFRILSGEPYHRE